MKRTLLFAAACLLVSCDQKPSTVAVETPPAPGAALSQVLAATPAGEGKAIHTVRATAKPGDEITLDGRIMGAKSPFVAGRAVFILGDPEKLTPCNELPDDDCSTPWDTCCDTPEDKKAGTATIQVVGADGRVLKEGIEGVGGLEKLARVRVTGTVAEGSSPELLVVNATAIRVTQ